MSAFIVQDKTINHIVNHLAYIIQRYDNLKKDILDYLANDRANTTWQEKFANALFSMNIDAIEQRYGKGEAKDFRPLDFKYNPIVTASSVQVYKDTGCLLYQCAEGDVYQSKLYKLLERIKHIFADEIITHLPEYDKSGWDE